MLSRWKTRKHSISALLPSVTKSRSKGLESRPFTRPRNNVPGSRPPSEFWDEPPLALFFVRLLREDQYDTVIAVDPRKGAEVVTYEIRISPDKARRCITGPGYQIELERRRSSTVAGRTGRVSLGSGTFCVRPPREGRERHERPRHHHPCPHRREIKHFRRRVRHRAVANSRTRRQLCRFQFQEAG